jgi:hypothetical protein
MFKQICQILDLSLKIFRKKDPVMIRIDLIPFEEGRILSVIIELGKSLLGQDGKAQQSNKPSPAEKQTIISLSPHLPLSIM